MPKVRNRLGFRLPTGEPSIYVRQTGRHDYRVAIRGFIKEGRNGSSLANLAAEALEKSYIYEVERGIWK